MPPPSRVADTAAAYSEDIELLTGYAVEVIGRASGALAGGDAERWRTAVVDAAPSLLELQRQAVDQSDTYLTSVLEAQGADAAADARVVTSAFVDQTDGGGSWMRNLVYAPPSGYADAIAGGVSPAMAAARARYVATAVVTSGLRDMARSAVSTSMFTRPTVYGYVRVLRGISCARCAILAGRHYRKSAFQRHPRCDCYMLPTAQAGDSWHTDPRAYFRSLSTAEQDAIFGAGADAIRAGANIAQVVNAYDGVSEVAGFTTTGTTRRGTAGRRLGGAPRLLPDEIILRAEREGWTREQTLAVLYQHGYVM